MDRRGSVRAREELRAAILLVAGGRFPRVTVANLAAASHALRDVRSFADAAGVEVRATRSEDTRSWDVVVTPR